MAQLPLSDEFLEHRRRLDECCRQVLCRLRVVRIGLGGLKLLPPTIEDVLRCINCGQVRSQLTAKAERREGERESSGHNALVSKPTKSVSSMGPIAIIKVKK